MLLEEGVCSSVWCVLNFAFQMRIRTVGGGMVWHDSSTLLLLCTSLDQVRKQQIMASRPIASWQIDGETVETVTDFIWGGSKITEDGDCSHEIKRCLFLEKKVMTNLDSILKSRDIPLPTKVRLVKAMVFPVVVYGCES